MRQLHRSRLGLAVGGLALVAILTAVTVWVFLPRPLPPDEAAVVGDWQTPTQPDGSSTVIALNSDRTCRVRWLDAAGGDDPGSPPQNGRWRIDRGVVVVNTRRTTWVLSGGGVEAD